LGAIAAAGQTLANPATGQSITFLETAADTAGERLVMESAWTPHGPRPPAHYHPRQEEHFEVLEGTLGVQLDGEELKLGKGASFDVPAGTVHEMWNAGDEEARVRWEVRPAMRTEELTESLFGLAQDGLVNDKGVPNPLQAAAILNAHRDELRLSSPPWPVQRVVFPALAAVGRLFGYRGRYERGSGRGA
jgi:quercetin dioxygenase-like cupin family protein